MFAVIRRLPKAAGERGVTLMEIIVILAVIGALAAAMVPMVLNYYDDARKAKAEADVKALAQAIHRLTQDVAHFPFYKDGTRTTGPPDYELLRGPGNDPLDHDSKKWLTAGQEATDELENHLVKNNPGGTPYAASGHFRWRGPYLELIGPDSWGNSYLVNIKNADPAANPPKVVWVLTAGPNGKIETDPDALADSGPTVGGDDIAVRIK